MLTPPGRRDRTYPSLHAGATIAGKYRVRRLLGQGGMGAVYKAENTAIGRTVAIKVLHPHLADDGITLARFQREARAAASVGHKHVVEVLDLGVEASGAPYLVMEYVRGKSLGKLIETEGPIEPRRAARICGQVLSGLAAVHDRKILHRDLKPENVFLTAA
ncbi:MAG: serine/threonine protein kinase, partial [Polyangiaceae bacterium]|nr:serine/threonine protein kinase [Polyangiaceae bacterium]